MAVLGLAAVKAVACPHGAIEVVVPYPAGGSLDGIARIVADGASRTSGRSFVVKNVGGGEGTVGVKQVLHRRHDGCTVLVGTVNTLVLAPAGISSAHYSFNDFQPVGLLGLTEYILLANPAIAVTSFGNLAEVASKKEHPLSFGHPGMNTLQYLGLSMVARELQLPVLSVPYKGAAPMLKDLVGGHIDLALVAKPAAAAAAERGLVTVVGNVSEWSRQQGRKGPAFPSWASWFVPASVPAKQVRWLTKTLDTTMSNPQVVSQLEAVNAPPASAKERADFLTNYKRDSAQITKHLAAEAKSHHAW